MGCAAEIIFRGAPGIATWRFWAVIGATEIMLVMFASARVWPAGLVAVAGVVIQKRTTTLVDVRWVSMVIPVVIVVASLVDSLKKVLEVATSCILHSIGGEPTSVDMDSTIVAPANRLGVAMTVKTKIATKNINNLNFANVLSRLMSFSFPFEGESR